MLNNVLAVANEPAISTARKFSFCYRWGIYRAAARSRSAGQLAVTFPLAACRLYDDDLSDSAEIMHARDLVERGRSLRDVARNPPVSESATQSCDAANCRETRPTAYLLLTPKINGSTRSS
jgi:hypothetical protein